MAFPTSPSNNQVHKEGNRSFVYDSTLGVWDQVGENTVLSTENDATFSAGHPLQCKGDNLIGKPTTITTTSTHVFGADLEVEMSCGSTSNYLTGQLFLPDIYQATNTSGFWMGFVWSANNWTNYYGFHPNEGSQVDPQKYAVASYTMYGTGSADILATSASLYASVPTTSPIKIRPYLRTHGGTYSVGDNAVTMGDAVTLIIMEVQG